MRSRRWIVVAAIALAVVGTGAWLAADRLFPVPATLVGTWENETPVLAAGPGEVRLTISRDGMVVAEFDRTRYAWWGADRFRVRVRGGQVFVRPDSDREPEEPLAIEVGAERFRVWDPTTPRSGGDELVFRRVARP